MKLLATMLSATMGLSLFAALNVPEDDLRIVEVTVTTPLKTGLEAQLVKDPNSDLYKAIRNTKGVKDLIDVAEKRFKKLDKLYQSYGVVEIDCEKQPDGIERLPEFCAFTATKNYGWYADLDLKLKVTGYIHNRWEKENRPLDPSNE